MNSLLKKVVPDATQRTTKKYKKTIEQINGLEETIMAYSDEELQNKTIEFKERLENGESHESIKVEAFAVVREASRRVLGQRHYDVQLMGGLALAEGNIAEMATGEGKTLVASLPAYYHSLTGEGVHVITANDYLAKRDHDTIGPIHQFLGLTVGLNIPNMAPEEKRQAYNADITYGVGNEFGFDYLRDHIVRSAIERVQRPYHYAIIDEIDSILIDEAKTPLILAAKTTVSKDLFYITSDLVKTLEKDEHFFFDVETKATNLTDDGITFIEKAFDIDNLYDLEHQTLYHYVIQSLRAELMFERDVDYIVKDGEVHLVDPFTGRVMEGRSLSNGLHQAIEAKEGLVLTEENRTQASITIQNYFRKYPILSGMTGTAKTEEKEFQKIYNMDVVSVPTNRPKIREDLSDRVFATKKEKYMAVAQAVFERHQNRQPVLIGTTSISQSEKMADALDALDINYQLLNAKSVQQEASIIALAGQSGKVTIATNMAGRGTDIILGEGVSALLGLHVIGTERHESRRVDNQLKGRSGRQGDPGSSQFYLSLEDDLVQRYAEDEIGKMQKRFKPNDHGEIVDKKVLDFFDRVQRICEGKNFSNREYTLKLDDVINSHREIIYHLRDMIIDEASLNAKLFEMLESRLQSLIETYCPREAIPEEWDLNELKTHLKAVLPSFDDFSEKFPDRDTIIIEIKAIQADFIEQVKHFEEDERFQNSLRQALLYLVDYHWTNHLEAMDHLKEGIGLRSYGQQDPLIMFQEDGFKIFNETYEAIEMAAATNLAQLVGQLQNEQ